MFIKLDDQARADLSGTLPDWQYDAARDGLTRVFRFSDFMSAFCFMTSVAILAERHDHHPEWSNVFNRVEIFLTTHDAEGLSERDVLMAHEIDRVAQNFNNLRDRTDRTAGIRPPRNDHSNSCYY